MSSGAGGRCDYILVKTVLGMERVAASYIAEIDPGAEVIPAPRGFKGLVLVRPSRDKYKVAEELEKRIPEAEKIVVIEGCAPADPREIARVAAELAPQYISSNETFAVRTVRRGRHNFTSIDVNVVVGDAVRRATGARVNLRFPDKVVAVEIIADRAFIAFYPGSKEWKKMRPGKYPVYKLLRRIAIVQMPYLGPLDACKTMGVRIGREVQNFEVGELVIAPIGLVDALQLKTFLEGVFEGIESRYQVQVKSYGRQVYKVPVYVQDLYQLVRSRFNEPIIVFEPEGDPVSKRAKDLYELLRSGRRVNMLFGSREGIPEGVYRFANLVLDFAPGVTLSTEYAAAAAVIAVVSVVHDYFASEEEES
ncbi:SPOUT family RNA methylase [Hyperthermus butylicus]|uniref:RNA binding protein, THUMP domain n=1 Tax=Hyperthermus butylicus (strain DSM 5456 / JCM 9403 / PLM1-5) TaxID=415426 RepID=A2BJY2_HYPBU|nr:SPOUT family RNA methylase [Hyperthermus butylicus]ABM80293.1 RNA binding protein, THUMP domain [Hyperthermus butylicus DSM 5456]